MLKIKKPKINDRYILVMLGCLCLFVFLFSYYKYSKTYQIQCESYLTYDSSSQLSFETSISMRLSKDGSGIFSLEGTLTKNGKKWSLNRDVLFDYIKLKDNSIQMHKVRFLHYGQDNTPEDLFRETFLTVDSGSSRVLTITKMKNTYLVGNRRTPVFTCVPHPK